MTGGTVEHETTTEFAPGTRVLCHSKPNVSTLTETDSYGVKPGEHTSRVIFVGIVAEPEDDTEPGYTLVTNVMHDDGETEPWPTANLAVAPAMDEPTGARWVK